MVRGNKEVRLHDVLANAVAWLLVIILPDKIDKLGETSTFVNKCQLFIWCSICGMMYPLPIVSSLCSGNLRNSVEDFRGVFLYKRKTVCQSGKFFPLPHIGHGINLMEQPI